MSTVSPKGTPKTIKELTIAMSLPGRKVKSLDVPLRKLDPTHYLSPGFTVPFDGEWKITAKALLSEFEEETVTGSVDVE